MKYFFYLLMLLLVLPTGNNELNAQIVIDTGDVYQEITSIISNLPSASQDDYTEPDSVQMGQWGALLDNLLALNYDEVADSAAVLDYNLIQFYDTTANGNTNYYILKSNGLNYWGTYVFNPNYCRPLVIQSPHPKKDFNTGKEGIHVFRTTEALFFCLSGTHRCNSLSFSSCTGTTSTCTGSSEDYRISDLAHNLNSIFQISTDTLLNQFGDAHFIQLHGFTKKITDPYLILSNGTQITPTPDYISIFKDNLLLEDDSLTFKIAHIDLDWNRLRGFYNTQGRLINSSPDYCNADAILTNGRFIHMEQEKNRLRLDILGWEKVSNALKNSFECLTLSVKLLNFYLEKMENGNVLIQWDIIEDKNYNEYFIERSKNGQLWEVIYNISEYNTYGDKKTNRIIDFEPYFGVSYYRMKQIDNNGLSRYSEVKIMYNVNSDIIIYPNPSYNIITIENLSFPLDEFKLIDVYGNELIGNYRIQQKTFTKSLVDISDLPLGIYFVKTNKGIVNKFLKI